MSYKSEFPKWNGDWYCLDGFKDESCHTNELPSASKAYKKDDVVIKYVIWQDYIPTEENDYYSFFEDEGMYRFEIYVDCTLIYAEYVANKDELKEKIRYMSLLEYEGWEII